MGNQRGTSIEIGGVTLACSSAGDPKRPALVLLHGWPFSRSIYDGVIEDLSDDAFVLAFDLPDIGGSRGRPPSAEKHVLADLMLTAAESLGASSILIAGIDVGGMIAFAAARDHGARIAGAAVINTVLPGVQPWSKLIADPRIWHFAFHAVPDLPETLVAGRERAYFEFFFNVLAGNKAALTEDMRAAFARAYERPEALKAGFDWYRAFERDARHNAKVKPIDTPLFYLRGDADGREIGPYVEGLRAVGAQRLESRVIRNCGEYAPLEAPAQFSQVLRDLRARLETEA
ncbi:alpha/beta hydrolase [Rhizobium sp. BK418]|uniref:alpha/beta fold hydrolase n=1 Tax=Rhizobium sp. BK418 TaxID=2512120 RepID=UPI001042CBEA|nr:alpha/beta hydrolase [Rhizobium sp. BK418]TCS04581.1 pimeloyl-ACP methyl ester carboxylesterase [Rhizobium sp. BK418]